MPEKAFVDLLLDHPHLFDFAKVDPDIFQTLEVRWVIAVILDMAKKSKTAPTRIMVHNELKHSLREDDPYEAILALVK